MNQRLFGLIAVLALVFTSQSHAQSLGFGSVVFSITDGKDLSWIDFNLCCGEPQYGVLPPNGFEYDSANYDGGTFSLDYTGPGFCAKGCTYNAEFTAWNFPVALDASCEILSGTLTGLLHFNDLKIKDWNDATAEYVQVWCHQSDQDWYAGGDLTVHRPKRGGAN